VVQWVKRSCIITAAVAWLQSLAQKLPHAVRAAGKKKKNFEVLKLDLEIEGQ